MLDLRIVDMVVDNPSIETEEGVLHGDTVYSMVVEMGPNVRRRVDINSDTYATLHNFVYGES